MTYRLIAALVTSLTLAAVPAGLVAQEGPTVATAASEEHGTYLIGPGGKPLYMFRTNERGGDGQPPLISCRERCLEEWPLVQVGDELTIGEAVEADLATTITWEGREVLVYDGRAMFTYHRDTAGGEPQGHGIHTHGGWWFLVGPGGEAIEAPGLEEVED